MSFIGTMRLSGPTLDWHARCSVAPRILGFDTRGQAKKEGRNALLFCLPTHPLAGERAAVSYEERGQQAATLYTIEPLSPCRSRGPRLMGSELAEGSLPVGKKRAKEFGRPFHFGFHGHDR